MFFSFMKKLLSVQGWICVFLYIIVGTAFLGYSYTQVDLGLTLTQASIWRSIQTWFQHIGYFERPLSTILYLTIIAFLFLLYGYVLHLVRNKKLTTREVWTCIGALVLTTCIAYPAFSYDFFNYLFTAKTVLIYHKNPYIVTPLQFAGVDPWLSFMHWTHLASAYTPLWIIVTLIPYILGFGYFLPLIWNLKAVIALAYIGTALGIGKILETEDNERKLLGIAIFALNPLIIVECLISPHNDILMMAMVVWAMVLYRNKKKWLSWLLLSGSIAMKLMTIFLIPAFFTGFKRRFSLCLMSLGFIAVLFQREVLSWYWVWVVPFVALVPNMTVFVTISIGISLGLLLRYAPFLYYGHWNNPVPLIKNWVTWVPIGVSIVFVLTSIIKKRFFGGKKTS